MISLLFGYEQVAKRIANIRLTRSKKMKRKILVTVHIPLSREVFWHEYAKIPRHTSQNSIAAGNLE
ncbi:hypothetical protein DWY28_07320 [Ruminococcus sp. AF24-32LB]|nr:hypothetical protein DXD97_03090 [Ruminococcus sp. TM10-9AT]RGW22675.1 hypothetical protein DWV90_01825 [Ruminococcus sp. AF13-37]RGW24431.1 hypothetical protein DWV87_01885 [Ruminococcus sp. AF13-28]RGY92139.1 hypothetical protein DXA17_07720 [Ruminococcus sp. AM58-7XD]RHG55716.1 hypothetical protein DW253_07735 [Ruminococcus sp. AM22-13]RHO91270.1 hypothetical protein DW061_03710 [Ruminococcus sp. AF42-9BH]RHQ65083.1 hypothetical protein DWY28_07320 [Ruminococcus sp. AF24-32LB]RHQ97371.